MKSFLFFSLLVLTTAGASAQRGPEVQDDRIVATADGTGITLSDIRRQIDPNMGQLRAGAKNDAEFKRLSSTPRRRYLTLSPNACSSSLN